MELIELIKFDHHDLRLMCSQERPIWGFRLFVIKDSIPQVSLDFGSFHKNNQS